MTNALADSDACKDSSAAGVLAKEGERNRERGIGREEDNTIASLSLRLMNDAAYEICCAACIPRIRRGTFTCLPQNVLSAHC